MTQKPIIGITASYVNHNHFMQGVYVHQDYHQAILASGGIPLVLPVTNKETVAEYVRMCAGFILSGGEDVDPHFYNQDPHQKLGFVNPDRDEVELELIKGVLDIGKPLFGICRGLQLLNVALGGTLIQDIPSQTPDSMQHFQTVPRGRNFHSVTIDRDSHLYEVLNQEKIRVNSLHHQAIHRLSLELKVVSQAADGIIEAVEHRNAKNVFAVQWHPESLFATDEMMKVLFKSFISSCVKSKKLVQC
jgi:putative glutamine amidotransferase